MNTRQIRKLARAVTLVAAVGLYGCEGQHAASYLDSARSYMAKADYKAAIIEAKNALQKEPANGEARLVLAQALFGTGDAAGAETEVRKAIDAGISADRAYPLLAHALIREGQFAKVTKELGTLRLETPEARTQLAIALASAHAAQGNVKEARSAVDAVLAEQPGNVDALLVQAQLAAGTGDLAGARKSIESALKEAPKNAAALLTKAKLELVEHRPDSAQKLMEQAIDAHPDAMDARAALVSLAITTGKRDVAKAQVEKMKELAPGDLRTVYSDAFLAYAEGDNKRARDTTQRLLAARPDHLPSVMLSGLVDLQLGSYATAEEKLRRVLQSVPSDLTTRRALAVIDLRRGRAQEALGMIEPALKTAPDDPTLLRIAGEAYLASGKAAQAAAAYERANAVDKGNVASQVRLAQVRFATGDTARAFNELESLSSSDASAGQADLALFAAHLKRHEYDKALAVVDTIEKKQPKSAVPYNLRGVVYFAKRDFAKARENFEKALEIQPDYISAASSLATIDIQEGKLQAARDRYDRLLAKNPKNEQLLLASSQLLMLSGASDDQVRSALDKAVAANPSSTPLRLARISYDIRRGDGKAALGAAQAALTAIPRDPQITDLLATAQFMSGDTNQAAATMKQLVAMQPENPAARLRLAQLQAAMKEYPEALESARAALALKADYVPALGTIVKIYLTTGRPEAAIAEARKLQKDNPDKAIGHALEGEILAAQKKWPEAVVAYRAALKKESSPVLAARLHMALGNEGKQREADAMAAQWIKDHPKDPSLVQILAEEDQRRKQYGEATAGYKRVLEMDPDNVAALNNLAWILTEQGKPEALEYAERAHRLAPFNPSVLDTLGWTAARTGNPKRGAQLLRMATALAPKQSEIRLHLAKALVDSGDKAGARQALTELSKLDKDSPIRAEAEKLLANL
jgi:putative PEP-CTERM system TPR-repeat lipoprotein